MNKFIYGRTKYCCKCGGLAVNWYGWLRKSRDGIKAGFCQDHIPENKADGTLHGIFNKGMVEVVDEINPLKYGLHKNTIEQ